jgi:CheY-like chemotaxis protein
MCRVLVVDDEPDLRDLLVCMLREQGHTVQEAGQGLEALRLQREGPADVVLVDLIMPDMEGLETIQALRKESPATKLIAMTGGGRNGTTNFLAAALKLGASHALTKPFTKQALFDAIDKVTTV